MSDKEDQSPYGRGFVTACIVIAAILLCGALLLITGLTSPTPNAAADATPAATTSSPAPGSTTASSAPGEANSADTPGPGSSGTGDPMSAGTPGPGSSGSGDPALTGTTVPAAPDAPASAGPGDAGASACGLPDGDQGMPVSAPAVDGWEVSRRVVVPRSAVFGPGKVDQDGFRRCFAHSPSGAVYAAYNAIAAMGDQAKGIDTVGKLMLPGPDRDALIRELRAETPDDVSEPTQLAGYRVLDASRDRATVTLALPVESEYVSATLTFVWQSGDWRLVPPAPGESVGAPYSQHADLDGFVAWSGV